MIINQNKQKADCLPSAITKMAGERAKNNRQYGR